VFFYYFWAFIGHWFNGHYAYFFLDPKHHGWDYVVFSFFAAAALFNVCKYWIHVVAECDGYACPEGPVRVKRFRYGGEYIV
jgi:hypothetical protein